MKRASICLLPLLLAGCYPGMGQDAKQAGQQTLATANQMALNVKHGAQEAATQARDNVYETSYKLKDWAVTPPPGKKPNLAVKASYCYSVLQDVVCYRQPMPGWEHRLVGYQGTDAEAPPPAQTVALPQAPDDTSMQPATRVANAQPIFVGLPPGMNGEKEGDAANNDPNKPTELAPIPKDQNPPLTVKESLPNPAIVPQL